MADIVTPEVRSRMMSGIRGRDTKPEVRVRKALHARGFRYRLHARKVPGRPDIVLPKFRAAVFVHGCFWHGHDCDLFRWPKTRREFWQSKIERNRARDVEVREKLATEGWRQLVIWECAMKGPGRLDFETMIDRVSGWIREGSRFLELRGNANGAR